MSDQNNNQSDSSNNVFSIFKNKKSPSAPAGSAQANAAKPKPQFNSAILNAFRSVAMNPGTGIRTTQVIKAGSLQKEGDNAGKNSQVNVASKINAYAPQEVKGQIAPSTPVQSASLAPTSAGFHSDAAISGLKENLKELQDLQSRLRFMLQELEEYTSN